MRQRDYRVLSLVFYFALSAILPGLSPSALATGHILVDDQFDRADSSVVGNAWVEVEVTGQTQLLNGALSFDAVDEPYRPLIYKTFTQQTSGIVSWVFDLDFRRTGSEGTYAFWMQLGDSSQLSVADPTSLGVAVNLKWGGPTEGLLAHEGLGYVVGGAVNEVTTVSGLQTVVVQADLDAQNYSIDVNGQLVGLIPFDNAVPIDTVRFFTNGLSQVNFASRLVDNVFVQVGALPNKLPVAVIATPAAGAFFKPNIPVAFSSSGSFDPDGTVAAYSWAFGDGATSTAANPTHTYTSEADFTVTLQVVDDEGGLSTPVMVPITISSQNIIPMAQDQNFSTAQGFAVSFDMAFTDPDGPGPMSFTIQSGPTNGALTGVPPNLAYTPDPGFIGQDSFTWSVTDGFVDSNIATITIDSSDGGWPGPLWGTTSTPEEVGLSSTGIQDYQTWMQQIVSGAPYGTVVIRFGKIVFEEYGGGATVNSIWETGSIRKPIASSLLGIALDEGMLSLDTVVFDVWPDIFTITGAEKDKGIIMRQLANATSGWKSSFDPGVNWQYKNIAFTAGGAVIGRLYNIPQDEIAPMVETRIKDVIGASSWNLFHDPDGWFSGTGPKLKLQTTMRDLARYGYLWLREGEWNGTQIMSASYVAEATQNQAAAFGAHYGYWWFTNDGQQMLQDVPGDCYYHIGNGDASRRTVLVICPSLDLVAVINTHASAYDITSGFLSAPFTATNDWIKNIIDSVTINVSPADGDLAPYDNPDGVINAADVLIAVQLVLGDRIPGQLQYAHGDMNADGVIDAGDLVLIQKAVLQ